MIRIELSEGKYTIIEDLKNGTFKALRHGEEWRNLIGDNLVLSLAHELDEAREKIKELESRIPPFVKPNSLTEERFISLILEFLGEEVKEHEIYGEYEVTMNLRDVNLKVNGVSWEDALEDYLKSYDIEIRFNFGDNHWATVRKFN